MGKAEDAAGPHMGTLLEVWSLMIGLEGNEAPYIRTKPQNKPQEGERLASTDKTGHLLLFASIFFLRFYVISPRNVLASNTVT